MGHITPSLFAAICFISTVYGTGCSAGPGYRFPITCPGVLNSSKSYCCEINGSFQCCDEEEFARQEEKNDDTKSLAHRNKRDAYDLTDAAARYSEGGSNNTVYGTSGGILFFVLGICLRCYLYCCCWCKEDSNDSRTNLTQSSEQSSATPQQPPPPYNQEGYSRPIPLGFV